MIGIHASYVKFSSGLDSALQACCPVSWFNDSTDCTACSCFVCVLDFRRVRAVVVVVCCKGAPFIIVTCPSDLLIQSAEGFLKGPACWNLWALEKQYSFVARFLGSNNKTLLLFLIWELPLMLLFLKISNKTRAKIHPCFFHLWCTWYWLNLFCSVWLN